MHGSGNSQRVTWQQRVSVGSAEAYVLATFFVVVASLIRWGFAFISKDIFLFASFYPAVLFATYVGGSRVGAFAAVLGAATAWWGFIPHPLTSGVEIKLLAYATASSLIIWGAEHYRRLMKRLEDEETFRKLAVEELAHRLKNKLATIQSIISFQLRDKPEVRDVILRRLGALSATDDLIIAAQGRGALIRDILSAELRPYELSRITMDGPDCLFSPKLALTMALLFHELATNAAKYGSLSSSAGKLTVAWSLSDNRLNLEWRESGGPAIAAPAHWGFGTRLLLRSLKQFGGSAEAVFEPTGLICKLNIVFSEFSPGVVPEVAGNMSAVIPAE